MCGRTFRRLAELASRAFLVGVGLIAIVGAVSSAAAAATAPTQAIEWLNAQRAANGIPAGITDDPDWDTACEHHLEWLAQNPHPADAHVETPGDPGYTPDGAWAGAHSVLFTGGADWTPSNQYPWGARNPWENTPIHLMQQLSPDLSVTGWADNAGVCLITWPGYQRAAPSTPELVSYPGNGTSFIPPSEDAYEQYGNGTAVTPGAGVGIPIGTTTGPYLYVFGYGTGTGAITAASLIGPSGPVAIATVDNNNPDVGSYLPAGGIIIPQQPLQGGTTYTASVTFAPNGPDFSDSSYASQTPSGPVSLTWSFTTAPNQTSFDSVNFANDVLRATSNSPLPITAVIQRLPSRTVVKTVTLASGSSLTLNLPGARYRACFTQSANQAYSATGPKCVVATWRSNPGLRLGPARRIAGRVLVRLRALPELAGTRAQLTLGVPSAVCRALVERGRGIRLRRRLAFYHREISLSASETIRLPVRRRAGAPELLTVCIAPTQVGEDLFGFGTASRIVRVGGKQ